MVPEFGVSAECQSIGTIGSVSAECQSIGTIGKMQRAVARSRGLVI